MSGTVPPAALGHSFADPVLGSQRVFRAVLSAMSEPGTIHRVDEAVGAPSVLMPAAARVLLTLVDHETPVWLANAMKPEGAAFLRFHCSARVVDDVGAARFAVVDRGQASPALSQFDAGNDIYPDRSATVIVQCEALSGGRNVRLEGPGIRSERMIAPRGLRATFWEEVAANHARYPLGIDLILAAGDDFLALPRTTRTTLSCSSMEAR